jgi:glycosyltransferase involved in cell wall biosynthesis
MTDMAANDAQGTTVFIGNGTYCEQTSGGEIHFFHMVEAALAAGRPVDIFGGHALKKKIDRLFPQGVPVTLTDRSQVKPFDAHTLGGQFRLLWDYGRRFIGSVKQLDKIKPTDSVYAVSDYWFDVWPLLFCRARRKLMILGMDAPTLQEIIFRLRPDVDASRLNSIYYWLSQNLSLWLFLLLGNKRLFYVHPDMKPRLLAMGYREEEIVFISNGMNLKAAEQVPPQKKEYDVVWLGRVHRQKGIDDLLAMFVILAKELKDFRAVLVGRLDELAPRLAELKLSHCVTLTGLVSEEEKFRLFKASRVFLMPSRQESWGIVIAEALACDVPVVAYDLPAYRPIFGGLIDYVPSFNFEMFKKESREAIAKARRGEMALDARELALLKSEHSWEAAGNRFIATLKTF